MEFDLDAILSTPTQSRSEVETEKEENNSFDLSDLEFEDNEEEYIENEIDSIINDSSSPSPSQETRLISKEDARTGAELVINLLDSFNQVGLSRLAQWKLKRKLGSKKVIAKMQALFEKDLEGDEELTKKEKNQLAKYNRYLRDKEGISDIVSFSDHEKEKLIKSLTDYFMKKNIHFGGKDSFWFELIIAEGVMITQILTL